MKKESDKHDYHDGICMIYMFDKNEIQYHVDYGFWFPAMIDRLLYIHS